ncbi:hypothetical protein [Streptomyces sp. Tue6028]|uniref:hypothetical protein n=1 Tax=Streptomyces sp. Tue6028 TaxID=2036037 RepID=UPI003EB8AA24
MAPDAPVLVLDGPPGAGKTSLLARMVCALGDETMWFTEPNARLAEGLDAPVHPSPAGHTLWYLRHERAKARALRHLVADPATRLFVSDRNHLGALAYCYATRTEDSLPYRMARDFYARRIAPELPETVLTAILLVSLDQSLTRRGKVAELPRWEQWFDEGLLERLHTFYTDIAPTLCPIPPVIIDTDGATPEVVLAQVAGALADAGFDQTVQRLTTAAAPNPRPPLDEQFAGAYAQRGGLEAFGHPFTPAIAHRGSTVQLCQLGALHRDPAGRTRLWNPLGDPVRRVA